MASATSAGVRIVKVFLSSTVHDLLDLRQELRAVLEANGFAVALSEDPTSPFTVDPLEDSIVSCLNNVEASDAVVCILDRRYGGVMTSGPHKDLSATHAEIRHARDLKRPAFFFIRDYALLDYEQLRSNSSYDTRWVEPKRPDRRQQWFDLVAEISTLPKHHSLSNWYDRFRTIVDLKPLVLKRLSDQFPEHRGVIAMRPDRLVRLYFIYERYEQQGGHVYGWFENVGIGPALNITHGVRVRKTDNTLYFQGALAQGDRITTSNGSAIRYPINIPTIDCVLFCEYDNRFGDRYSVEVPLEMMDGNCVPSPPEKFSVVSEAGGV